MDFIIWIIFFIIGCVFRCKPNDHHPTKHTKCTYMNSLSRLSNHHKTECSPDEMVYIARQSMRYEGSAVNPFSTDKSECQKHENPSSKECFRLVPAEFDVDFTSYFNISKKCNRMTTCTLGFNDYYYSVIKFLQSCALSGNIIFQQVRIMANYECLPAKDVIHVGNNITVNRQGTVYLVVSTKTRCHIKGKINASRILEQTHVELRISHSSNQICKDWSGAFHYNIELACLKGLEEILIDVDIRQTNASTILWIEIKGGHLQIDCREDQFSDHPLAGESSRILIFIIGGVSVVLVAGTIGIVVFIKMKFCKRPDLHELDTDEKVIPTTTLNPQDGVQYGEKNQRQSKDSEKQTFDLMSNCAISNTNTTETSLPVQDGNYSLVSASDFEGGNDRVKDSNIDTIETSLPVQDGIYSLINASDFEGKNDRMKDKCFDKENSAEITEQSDAVNTVTNQIIGEMTGDVYASVCKRDNLEDSRITGPKGDIYTTVSTTLKTK